jgi:2-C-methyl-D-erythritol 4-phosphate cytidylyltransferase
MSKVIAVLLAAGASVRASLPVPKQVARLAGKPLFAYGLETFSNSNLVDEICIVVSEDVRDEVENFVIRHNLVKVSAIILGGATRNLSTLNAISHYESFPGIQGTKFLTHDVARPLISEKIIAEVIHALDKFDAVDVAIPSSDTVIEIDLENRTIETIPDRKKMWLGQTPQGFKYEIIKKAYELASANSDLNHTDDCSLIYKYLPEKNIYVVQGDLINMKFTLNEDLLLLDKLLHSGANKHFDLNQDQFDSSYFYGKRVVVFGGTRGIGKEIAELAQKYGAEVWVHSRATGTDISNENSVRQALELSKISGDGGIDLVINCAAQMVLSSLVESNLTEIREQIDVNLLGTINVAKESFEYLRKARGSLLLFSSSSYTYGRAGYSIYGCTKAAVVNLTQALADEWAASGIRVNCVSPSRTDTEMRSSLFGEEPKNTLLSAKDVAEIALIAASSRRTGGIFDVISRNTE